MSRGLARIGSRTFGTCSHPSHRRPIQVGGTLITGAPTVTTGNLPDARIGDSVVTDCGHVDLVISGSTTVTSNILSTARIGDSTGALGIYVAIIITGDPKTTTL